MCANARKGEVTEIEGSWGKLKKKEELKKKEDTEDVNLRVSLSRKNERTYRSHTSILRARITARKYNKRGIITEARN